MNYFKKFLTKKNLFTILHTESCRKTSNNILKQEKYML